MAISDIRYCIWPHEVPSIRCALFPFLFTAFDELTPVTGDMCFYPFIFYIQRLILSLWMMNSFLQDHTGTLCAFRPSDSSRDRRALQPSRFSGNASWGLVQRFKKSLNKSRLMRRLCGIGCAKGDDRNGKAVSSAGRCGPVADYGTREYALVRSCVLSYVTPILPATRSARTYSKVL